MFIMGITPLFDLSHKYKTVLKIFLCLLFFTGIQSCSKKPITLCFTCQERQIEIYVDGEYLGRDQVYYTVPNGKEFIDVSCVDGGLEVYHRRISVAGRDATLIELQIPKNYKYSSKPF